MLRHTENPQEPAASEAGEADGVDPAAPAPGPDPSREPGPEPGREAGSDGAAPDGASAAGADGALGADTAARLDEAILGGARRYTLSELIERTGLSQEFIESYWRWMGLPVTHPTEHWFTEADGEALREIAELFEAEQMDKRAQMTFVRSMGHTTERLALWQVEALVEHFARRHELDDASARLLALDRLPPLAETLGRQLEHAWRRQLAALTGRMAVEFAGARADEPTDSHQLPLPRAVGFADIVSFTKRTAGLGSAELAEFVQRFEAGARDVITTAGGRVVKTIGDAVLFVADDVTTGAEVALGLAESTARALGTAGPEDAEIPVRVGFVWGRVLSRFGDVFGPSVNLASRLTELAEPSTVLVDTTTATQLANSARYALTAQPEQDVPGIGPLVPVRLQRAYFG